VGHVALVDAEVRREATHRRRARAEGEEKALPRGMRERLVLLRAGHLEDFWPVVVGLGHESSVKGH
jgi:hypothetical protein